jgi:hypothetical protein
MEGRRDRGAYGDFQGSRLQVDGGDGFKRLLLATYPGLCQRAGGGRCRCAERQDQWGRKPARAKPVVRMQERVVISLARHATPPELCAQKDRLIWMRMSFSSPAHQFG